MKTNIFMKSVLRQPVRTLVLAMLIGIAAFAFVARAAEFVIVRGEIRRVEGLFPSIGVLSPISLQNITTDHDVTYAAQIVAASRYLAFEDRRVFTQGVLHGRRSQASHVINGSFMMPFAEDIDVKAIDQYFYATVLGTPRFMRGNAGINYLMLWLEVDAHIVGDPRAPLRYEPRIFTNERGQSVTLNAREFFFLPMTTRETELWQQGLFDPLGTTVGGRYMFRGFMRDYYGAWRGFLRPLGGEDGLRLREISVGGMAGMTWPYWAILEELRDDNLVFAVDAADQAAVDAMLERIRDDLYVADMNLSSVTVVGTKDMTAIPRFAAPYNSRLLDIEGNRWLVYDDYLNANPVALIPGRLAIRSNLQVGDTFTITLRSNPRPAWIDLETESRWARHIEGWWEHAYRGWWGLPAGDDWRGAETHELTLKVAGVFWYNPVGRMDNFTMNEIFIPSSLIPDGFGWCDIPLLTGMYSFNLTSARFEDAFINRHGGAVEELGFTIHFLPSGFDVFDAAMAPTRTSITVNLAVFSAVSVLILALVIFLYLRQWSKSLAIVRALGMPTGMAMRRFFTPVFCIWVPAIGIGAVVGWFFSLNQAEGTLAAVEVMGEAAYVNPNTGLFFALLAGIILLTIAGVISSGFSVASRPVLEQIQGTVQKVRKSEAIPEPGVADFAIPAGGFTVGKPLATSRAAALPTMFRHITRRILRTPVKSALALVLALFFVMSLGWMDHTIHFTQAEIERFWNTTVVAADIVRSAEEDAEPIHFNFLNSYIGHIAVDTVLQSGFVQDAYLESLWQWGGYSVPGGGFVHSRFFGVSCLDGFVAQNTRTAMDTQLGVLGDSMEMEFAPGFDPGDFTFIPRSPVPIVIRQEAMQHWGLNPGDTLTLYTFPGQQAMMSGAVITRAPIAQAQIIGYFTGGLNRAVNRDGLGVSLVVPREFLRHHFQAHTVAALEQQWGNMGVLSYATARFYLDPARNRELDRLPDLVFAQLTDNSLGQGILPVPLELFIHDEIIRMVVEPMERNLAILQTLYPISIVAAAVLGFGLSLLIMLTNIKNAAIMRVLGLSRSKSQLSLWTEQFIVCMDGIIIGLIVLLVMGIGLGVTPFALAGVYLAGAALGSAVGAFIINAKAPLELLQVRE